MGEDTGTEIKSGMITKRAQQKRSISRTNYKERVFVLTDSHLAYHDGSLQVSVFLVLFVKYICHKAKFF